MSNIQESIVSILRERSVRRHLTVIVCMIAVAATFAVFWALHLNGITLTSGDLVCELEEHEHTSDCYDWVEQSSEETEATETEESESTEMEGSEATETEESKATETEESEATESEETESETTESGASETEATENGATENNSTDTEEDTESPQPGDTKVVDGVTYVYALVCGLEEHTHTETCYETASAEENSAAEELEDTEDAGETTAENNTESSVTAGISEAINETVMLLGTASSGADEPSVISEEEEDSGTNTLLGSTAYSSTALDATTSTEGTYYVADEVALANVDATGATDYIVYTVINNNYYVLDANGRLHKVNGLNSGSSISWASDNNLNYYLWNVTSTDSTNYTVYNSTYKQYLAPTYSPVTGTGDDATIAYSEAFNKKTGSVTLSGDFELTYTFKNTSQSATWTDAVTGKTYTDEYTNWFNYILEMYATVADGNGSKNVYLDVRADNYGWLANQDSSDMLALGDGLTDDSGNGSTEDEWAAWLELMKEGAEVTVNIVKSGATVTVTTTAAGATFTATAYVAEFEDAELTIYLTGQSCKIENVSYAYNYATSENSEISSSVSGSDTDTAVSGYRGAYTNTIEISGDFVLNYSFTNTGDTTNEGLNWNNYILEMYNSNNVYLDVRADNYGWITSGANIDTLTFGDGLADDDAWSAWLSTMKSGATVNVQVERIGGYVTVTSTAGGYTFTATAYVSEYADGCSLCICLTGEDCKLSDITYSYYTPVSMRTSSSAQETVIALADSSDTYAWTSTATLSSNLRSGDYTMLAQSATGYIEWANSTDSTNYLECLESSTPSTGITFVFAEVRSFTVHFDATNGGATFYAGFSSYIATTYEMDSTCDYFLVDASGATAASSSRYKSYAADGWYDIYSNTYYDYDSNNLVYKFAYDADWDATVCYTDWVPSSYDGGSSGDNYVVNGVDTSSFITTKVYDYNDFFDLYSAYLDTSLATVNASEHSETEAWTFTYLTNKDSDSNLILNNRGTSGLGVLFFSSVYNKYGLFSPNGRASIRSNGKYVNGQASGIDSRATGLTSSIEVDFDSENLLNYLYDTEGDYGPYVASTGTGIMGKTYVGEGNYLYQYNETAGYYYFDSAQNAAFYNQSDQRFYLYSYLVSMWKSNGTSTSDFLPFNYNNVGTVSAADATVSIDANSIDYFFGLSSEIEFYLPDDTGTPDLNSNSGYGNQSSEGSDMIFKFMGDDDVWVYVDYGTDNEQLVLDLGGIHSEVYGEINFSSGLVTIITNTETLDGSTNGTTYVEKCVTTDNNIIGIENVTYQNTSGTGNIYYSEDNSIQVGSVSTLSNAISAGDHTLTIFYLERGASESNCAICFNISSETYNLTLSKWAEELLGISLSGAEFTYYTSTDFTESNEASLKDSSGNAESTFEEGKTAYSLRVGRTYYIKETAYPDGYTDGGRYLSVTLSSDGVLTVVVYSSGGEVIETYYLNYNSGNVTWTNSTATVWHSVVYDSTNYSGLCYMTYKEMTNGEAGYYDIGLIIQNTKAYVIPTAGSSGTFLYQKAGFILGGFSITGLLIIAFYHFAWIRRLRAMVYKKEYTKEEKTRQKCFARMRGHPRERSVTRGHARDRPEGHGTSSAHGAMERRRGTGPGG